MNHAPWKILQMYKTNIFGAIQGPIEELLIKNDGIFRQDGRLFATHVAQSGYFTPTYLRPNGSWAPQHIVNITADRTLVGRLSRRDVNRVELIPVEVLPVYQRLNSIDTMTFDRALREGTIFRSEWPDGQVCIRIEVHTSGREQGFILLLSHNELLTLFGKQSLQGRLRSDFRPSFFGEPVVLN